MTTCLWLTVKTAASCIKQDIAVDVGALRDAGRLDLVEVCTPQDSGLVQAIREDGRQGTRLSIWNGFDLATTKGFNRTLEYLRLHKPRRVWWSPPCTPFSVVQNANQRTDAQVKKLLAKRRMGLRILKHIRSAIETLQEEVPDMDHYVEQRQIAISLREGPLVTASARSTFGGLPLEHDQ